MSHTVVPKTQSHVLHTTLCDMTRTYVWHDPCMCFQTFACVTCLIYTWRDSFICVTLLVYMRETRIFNQLQVLDYRVAKTLKMPYLYRSISEKEPYNHCLFCGKWPVTYKAFYGSSPPCMTRAYVFSNVPVCNMTLLQVTWLVLMCDMTCSNVWDEGVNQLRVFSTDVYDMTL